MIKISSVIITLNEEHNIERCIRSLLPVSDEIIVVDSCSTDKTTEIAKGLGAKIFFRAFSGFGDQKAYAIAQASNDWILSVDADEVLSPELQQSILSVKQAPSYNGYCLNILTNYCGKWIRHCGWYPKHKLRLLNKHHGSINHNPVHEGFVMHDKHASIGMLKGDLMHYSYNTLSDHSRKIQLYSELGARRCVEKGKKAPVLKIIFWPRWIFIYHYIIRLGFLDGYWGYILCKNISYESFIKYTKTRLYARTAGTKAAA